MSHSNEPPRTPIARARGSEEYGTAPEPGTVRLERLLPGSPERLWSYLTENDKRAVWLASGEMEGREGGPIELRFLHADLSGEKEPPPRFAAARDGHTVAGTVTRWDPPRVLAYTWGEPGDASHVTFELTPRGGDVLLVVTHRRLGTVGAMANVAAGWHTHVGLLLDHLEGREPRGFWSSHGRVEQAYAARLEDATPAVPPVGAGPAAGGDGAAAPGAGASS